jgi:hypothetical protein
MESVSLVRISLAARNQRHSLENIEKWDHMNETRFITFRQLNDKKHRRKFKLRLSLLSLLFIQ